VLKTAAGGEVLYPASGRDVDMQHFLAPLTMALPSLLIAYLSTSTIVV